MVARSRLDLVVTADVTAGAPLDVTAEKSRDGKAVTVRVVNAGGTPVAASLELKGFVATRHSASVIELTGALNAVNTAAEPRAIVPKESELELTRAVAGSYSFPARSFTVLRFE